MTEAHLNPLELSFDVMKAGFLRNVARSALGTLGNAGRAVDSAMGAGDWRMNEEGLGSLDYETQAGHSYRRDPEEGPVTPAAAPSSVRPSNPIGPGNAPYARGYKEARQFNPEEGPLPPAATHREALGRIAGNIGSAAGRFNTAQHGTLSSISPHEPAEENEPWHRRVNLGGDMARRIIGVGPKYGAGGVARDPNDPHYKRSSGLVGVAGRAFDRISPFGGGFKNRAVASENVAGAKLSPKSAPRWIRNRQATNFKNRAFEQGLDPAVYESEVGQ